MLENLINERLFEYRKEHYGKMPDMIIMAPITWYKLFQEIVMKTPFTPNESGKILYRGIKIIRSSDVEPDTFLTC